MPDGWAVERRIGVSMITADKWLSPGRKTIEGYLHVVRGPLKKDYGLFGNYLAGLLEERGEELPRYQDLHAVWFALNPEPTRGHELSRPFLRYKRERPGELAVADDIQVGWVLFDGDEFHSFRYSTPDDRHLDPSKLTGCVKVYVKREDVPGA